MKESCSSVDWLFPLIIVLHRPPRHYGNRRLYLNFIAEYIVEPRYNEGPRDWQNMFVITRFHFMEVLFHIFYYFGDN